MQPRSVQDQQLGGPRPLSLLQRGLAPRSKGKARAELRPLGQMEGHPEGRRPVSRGSPLPRAAAGEGRLPCVCSVVLPASAAWASLSPAHGHASSLSTPIRPHAWTAD